MTANELRDHLVRLDLSQMDFARMTHRGPRTVRRWVDGRRTKPVPKDIAMLVSRLHPQDGEVKAARRQA